MRAPSSRIGVMRSARLGVTFLLFASAALAASRTEAQRIEAAVKTIETSKVIFVRNGDEHSAAKAAEFMRGKLKRSGDKVKTFDQFVDELATKSSTSGKPYLVKLESGDLVPLAKWLREQDAAAK